MFFHLGLEGVTPGQIGEGLVADHDVVVVLIHLGPFQLAVGDHIEHPADHRPRLVHFADVMHADIPLITAALVHMGVAAGGVVLLQHTDFLP